MSLRNTVLMAKNTPVKVKAFDGVSTRSYSGFLNKRVAPHTITKQVFGMAKLKGTVSCVTITYIH